MVTPESPQNKCLLLKKKRGSTECLGRMGQSPAVPLLTIPSLLPVVPSSASPPPTAQTLLLKASLTSEKLDHVSDVFSFSKAG